MTGKVLNRFLAFFICIGILSAGCSSSSSSKSEPLETQDVSGVWIGSIYLPSNTGKTYGIVTEEDIPMFVGDSSIFIGHTDGDWNPTGSDRFIANAAAFTGNLDYSTWKASGSAYECDGFHPGTVFSSVLTKSSLGIPFSMFGGGAYMVVNEDPVTFAFLYNTAYDNPGAKEVPTAPTVNDLVGDWDIASTWNDGDHPNTLRLTVSGTAPMVTVEGGDTVGNHFTGFVTLHVTSPQKHVYDVSLTLNPGVDDIQMTGFAAFMNDYNKNNDGTYTFKDKILLIGAVAADKTHFLAAHATKVTH